MKSVITKLEANLSERVLSGNIMRTPYVLEVRGAAIPNALVHEMLDINTGSVTVLVQVPKSDGKPVLAVSTIDAIARRVKAGARAYAGNQGGPLMVRRYA